MKKMSIFIVGLMFALSLTFSEGDISAQEEAAPSEDAVSFDVRLQMDGDNVGPAACTLDSAGVLICQSLAVTAGGDEGENNEAEGNTLQEHSDRPDASDPLQYGCIWEWEYTDQAPNGCLEVMDFIVGESCFDRLGTNNRKVPKGPILLEHYLKNQCKKDVRLQQEYINCADLCNKVTKSDKGGHCEMKEDACGAGHPSARCVCAQ